MSAGVFIWPERGRSSVRREILIVEVWIDIHRANNGRCRNPIAFGTHALRINGVVSRLQRTASSASIPTSHSTACNQPSTSANCRAGPHMSRR